MTWLPADACRQRLTSYWCVWHVKRLNGYRLGWGWLPNRLHDFDLYD